jgi:hypothetical protein
MITVTSYAELRSYVLAAAQKKIGLLLIEGRGGTSKTYTIRAALQAAKKQYLLLNSHVTPASAYEQLFNHKDETIFINDVDIFFQNRTMLSIMKQVCETEEIKKIQYNSKTPLMADLPREFETSSNVIIDANSLPKKDKGMLAFLTRGVHLYFDPTTEELLTTLRSFAKDTTILIYLEHLARVGVILDLRKYIVAKELREAKLDWKKYLTLELRADADLMAALEATQRADTYAMRVKLFEGMTGKSGRTYDRLLRKVRE